MCRPFATERAAAPQRLNRFGRRLRDLFREQRPGRLRSRTYRNIPPGFPQTSDSPRQGPQDCLTASGNHARSAVHAFTHGWAALLSGFAWANPSAESIRLRLRQRRAEARLHTRSDLQSAWNNVDCRVANIRTARACRQPEQPSLCRLTGESEHRTATTLAIAHTVTVRITIRLKPSAAFDTVRLGVGRVGARDDVPREWLSASRSVECAACMHKDTPVQAYLPGGLEPAHG